MAIHEEIIVLICVNSPNCVTCYPNVGFAGLPKISAIHQLCDPLTRLKMGPRNTV